MNILIVSQYFWPEPFMINDLVLKIKELGHGVTVFTGKPNYPEGTLYEGYVRSGVNEELYKNTIPVYRVPLRPRKKASAKNLAMNYLSFVFSGLKHSFRFAKNKQFDVILVFSPSPITSAIPAILLKWLTKSHLAVWVQDLWPESVVATGFVRNRFALACLSVLVRGIYYCSDTLLAQSQAFMPHLARMACQSKISYYPNSVIDTFHSEEPAASSVPEELTQVLESQFCVVFAGNIGTAQAVETIVAAAEYLKEIPDLRIVLVGSGSKSDWIAGKIEEQKLANLMLAGRYPASDMPYIFSKASGLLVTLKSEEIFNCTIPMKIQSYLAAGKPIIASLDGEGAKVIEEAHAGFTSPAEDAEKLAKNIKALYHLPKSQREHMGKAGRAHFLKYFEMGSQSQRLIDIFEDRMNKKRSSK